MRRRLGPIRSSVVRDENRPEIEEGEAENRQAKTATAFIGEPRLDDFRKHKYRCDEDVT